MKAFSNAASSLALAAAAASAAMQSQAHAMDYIASPILLNANADIDHIDYSVQSMPAGNSIDIASSDGVHWDTVISKPLKLSAQMELETGLHGIIYGYGVFFGECNGASCSAQPLLYEENVLQNDYVANRTIDIPATDVAQLLNEISFGATTYAQELQQHCTNQMEGGGDEVVTLGKVFPTTFTADTGVGLGESNGDDGFPGGDANAQDLFGIAVNCLPYKPGFKAPTPTVSIETVNLYLSTFSHAVTTPSKGKVCKKGRILARIRTDGPGPVEARLRTEIDGVAETEVIETGASAIGSGVYEAEIVRWVTTDRTVTLDARIEAENGNFDIYDGWKSLKLECVVDTPDFAPTDGAPSPTVSKGSFGAYRN